VVEWRCQWSRADIATDVNTPIIRLPNRRPDSPNQVAYQERLLQHVRTVSVGMPGCATDKDARNWPAKQYPFDRGSPGSRAQVLIGNDHPWLATACRRHRIILGGGDRADRVAGILKDLRQGHYNHGIILDNQNAACGHDCVANGQRMAMSFTTQIAPGEAHAVAQAIWRSYGE
jgi:hypothetical protein